MIKLSRVPLPVAVHPHSRGENRKIVACNMVARGFIPTRAGKIGADHGFLLGRGVHPHSRGENVPHRWVDTGLRRFIPTRAGKIHFLHTLLTYTTVHPHSRGENAGGSQGRDKPGGSSPLARGKWLTLGKPRSTQGFIPTRAGKIIPTPQMTIISWVHPHSRGENCRICPYIAWLSGSSPLARGKS